MKSILLLTVICDVFLDLSKDFDNVFHDGLIYKLKSLGIFGSLLKLIQKGTA